jgi:pyroglutamyl-peptidase
MSVLVAAFEPFGGREVNRAERAVRRLRGLPDVEVATLPVSFARIRFAVDLLVARKPDVLILVGETARARGLELERFALNFADATIADNDGLRPRGEKLVPDGPLAREVRYDLADALAAITSIGVPAHASFHAGTFLCNAALYHALGHADAPGAPRAIAFVHLPSDKAHLRAGAAAKGLHALAEALREPRAFHLTSLGQ